VGVAMIATDKFWICAYKFRGHTYFLGTSISKGGILSLVRDFKLYLAPNAEYYFFKIEKYGTDKRPNPYIEFYTWPCGGRHAVKEIIEI
jgi:hypothetical protein